MAVGFRQKAVTVVRVESEGRGAVGQAGHRLLLHQEDLARVEAIVGVLGEQRRCARMRVVRGHDHERQVGLYKIFLHLCLCVQESISPLLPPLIRITHTTAILLRDCCAIYDVPPTLPLNAIHHTILVRTMSCKG